MKKYLTSVSVKAGILNTIAKSIYSDTRIKTREAVSNSIDNNATLFIITIDENTKSISFYDNGTGISEERFEQIFQNIGYGQTRMDNQTNSYFGLGLMSVLQLGNKAMILSKFNNKQINQYVIETQKIFSETTENLEVNNIKDYISIEEMKSPREEISFLKDSIIKKYTDDILPETFTEIILQNVEEDLINKVSSEDFIKQLRKILPLKPDYNDSYFNHISDKKKLEQIKINIFDNIEFCKTIRVFYGKIGYEEGYRELTKYYPDFKNDVIFTDADIKLYISKDNSFASYFLISSQDIEDDNKQSNEEEEYLNETGFWVRNRNFLIKSADFFQKPGSRKKIVDEPLKTWLYGEVFHKDMTKMLVVTRDEYLWENKEFLSFFEELKSFIHPINEEYREIWKRGKKIIKALVDPFIDVHKKRIFDQFDRVLLESGIIEEEKDIDDFLKDISNEFSNPMIEDKSAIIETLLKKNQSDLLLADNVEGDIKIVIAKSPLSKNYIRARDPETQNLIIKISPDVFSSFRTIFLGKNFHVHYVLKGNEKPDLSINLNNEEIFINISSQDLAKYSITFIEFILMVKVAHKISKNKDEMLRTLLDLIGYSKYGEQITSVQPGMVFSALEEIVNRR